MRAIFRVSLPDLFIACFPGKKKGAPWLPALTGAAALSHFITLCQRIALIVTLSMLRLVHNNKKPFISERFSFFGYAGQLPGS